MESWLWAVVAAAVAGLLWAAIANWLLRLSPRRDDIAAAVVLLALRVYAKLVHRLRVEGLEHIPRTREPGPLLVVSNHTAGVDPLLIQSVCPFEIRWIMAQDMRTAWVEPLWRWLRIIFIERDGSSALALREALRELSRGGVVGVFPEGRIERSPGELGVFHAGVGALAARSGAPILPFVIEGTPRVDSAWGSLWRPSRARLRVFPLQRDVLEQAGRRPEAIAQLLQRRYAQWTGWRVRSDGEAADAQTGAAGACVAAGG